MSKSNEYKKNDEEQSLLLSMRLFCLCVFIFWFICALFLYRQQLRLKKRRTQDDKFIELEPEDEGEGLYLVSFFTGSNYKQAPSGKVRLHLLGSLFPGKFHELYPTTEDSAAVEPTNLNLFSPLCREKFIITEDVRLGRINSIVLQTDEPGENSSWECQSVIIRDLCSNEAWYFAAKCKIGFPPEILQAATVEQLTTFKFSWHRRIRREVRQGQYVYFGFWFRPEKCVYTFFQRHITAITCHICIFSVCLLFIGLIFPPYVNSVKPTTADGYGNLTEKDLAERHKHANTLEQPAAEYWLGHAVTTGLVAACLTSLVGFILVTLFREKSKYETKLEEMDYVIGTALHEHDLHKTRHLMRECQHYDSVLKRCSSTLSLSTSSGSYDTFEGALHLNRVSKSNKPLPFVQEPSQFNIEPSVPDIVVNSPAKVSATKLQLGQRDLNKTEITNIPTKGEIVVNIGQPEADTKAPGQPEPKSSIWTSILGGFKDSYAFGRSRLPIIPSVILPRITPTHDEPTEAVEPTAAEDTNLGVDRDESQDQDSDKGLIIIIPPRKSTANNYFSSTVTGAPLIGTAATNQDLGSIPLKENIILSDIQDIPQGSKVPNSTLHELEPKASTSTTTIKTKFISRKQPGRSSNKVAPSTAPSSVPSPSRTPPKISVTSPKGEDLQVKIVDLWSTPSTTSILRQFETAQSNPEKLPETFSEISIAQTLSLTSTSSRIPSKRGNQDPEFLKRLKMRKLFLGKRSAEEESAKRPSTAMTQAAASPLNNMKVDGPTALKVYQHYKTRFRMSVDRIKSAIQRRRRSLTSIASPSVQIHPGTEFSAAVVDSNAAQGQDCNRPSQCQGRQQQLGTQTRPSAGGPSADEEKEAEDKLTYVRKFPRPYLAWIFILIILSASICTGLATLGLIGQKLLVKGELHFHMFLTTYLTALILDTFIIETAKMGLIGAYYAYQDKSIFLKITKEAKAKKKIVKKRKSKTDSVANRTRRQRKQVSPL